MKTYKLLLMLLMSVSMFSQVYSDKVVGKKNEALKDSLKHQEYPYILPIWGDKVAKKGFQLPYSAGVSVNYFWQQSDIIVNNLSVGFNNGPMTNLDQVIRFDNAVSTANSINIRPDVWVLPFLNVYGIFGQVKTSTAISAGLWVPDQNNQWSQIASFKTKANFDGTTAGFGLTPTIGVGGGWFALDMNMTWTSISALDKPAFVFVFGPRFGKTFKFNKPDSNIAFWAGGFRVKLSTETKGSLPISNFLPGDAQAKVDAGLQSVSDKQSAVNTWWQNLSGAEQANPINQAKYNTANKALETAGNFLTAVDGALSTVGSSTVQYSLQKKPADMWNFIIGSQYQFNRHYMLRAEYGFLGSRQQFVTGIQYRFGL